ncbi:hypothetical protein CTI12_AA477160 [Artemisia annua]|uniref:Uncharacterized protein n=1 Tax=Artemisia annua TaxID=35608 RepID=A0A2U1LLM2_ARTAN|nr:hypothetical protein CTI12_AA477160 [Artemisia annua]
MKIATKPISSPGRTDELPPQLIMFPRSKSSRGSSKSRSNPMFVRKINKNETIQEPSSPKVTCIGQVRANKRSSNIKQTTATRTTTNVRRCKWLPRNISLFRCGCRKPKILKESKQVDDTYGKCGLEDVTRNDNDVSISKSPPRNAFLLTRSSSLANKIWESTIDEKKCDETQGGINENIGNENEGNEGSIINGIEEFKAKSLNLSRCKSEPARTSDKLFKSFGS